MLDTNLTATDTTTNTATDSPAVESLSVSDVARLLEINRGTLYNRIKVSDSYSAFKAGGITGENNAIFYTETSWSKLLADVGLSLPAVVCQPTATTNTPTLAVIDSDQRLTVHAPVVDSIDLAAVRDAGGIAPATDVDNLLAAADTALLALDIAADRITGEIAERQQQLRRTQQTALALTHKTTQLKQHQQRLEIQSAVTGEFQHQAEQQIQGELEYLQSLGKSQQSAPVAS